jgi:hypothetical protein
MIAMVMGYLMTLKEMAILTEMGFLILAIMTQMVMTYLMLLRERLTLMVTAYPTFRILIQITTEFLMAAIQIEQVQIHSSQIMH